MNNLICHGWCMELMDIVADDEWADEEYKGSTSK
jgi:hypothetical protein